MAILVKKARLSFPNIFRPSAFSPDQPAKYSATFILDSADPQLKVIREEIDRVAKERWKGKTPKGLKLCLRDGSEKDLDGFGDGTVFFNASNAKRPAVFDRDRSALVEEDGKPYAGCFVNARIDLWAQDNAYGKRINATLLGLQFASDGESFGGGGSVAKADDFDEVEEDEADFLN